MRTGAAAPAAKMKDILLSIVEEKTGYPRDMVGLDQNLESDLGIDSIKRIEVVGAMLQTVVIQEQAITLTSVLGALAVFLASINIFGGFMVTERMLDMFKKKKK